MSESHASGRKKIKRHCLARDRPAAQQQQQECTGQQQRGRRRRRRAKELEARLAQLRCRARDKSRRLDLDGGKGIGVEECAGPILQQVVNGDGFEEAIAQPKTKQEMIDCQISEVLSAIEQLVVATIEENISSLTVGDEVDKKVAEIVGLRLKELEERLSAIEQAIDSLVAQQQEMNMDKGGPGEEVVGEETQPNQQKMDTQEKQEKIDSKTDGGEEKKMEEGADDKNEDGELGVGQKDAAQDDVDDEDITSETSKLKTTKVTFKVRIGDAWYNLFVDPRTLELGYNTTRDPPIFGYPHAYKPGIFYFEVLDEIVSIRCEAITDYYLTVDENRAVYFDEKDPDKVQQFEMADFETAVESGGGDIITDFHLQFSTNNHNQMHKETHIQEIEQNQDQNQDQELGQEELKHESIGDDQLSLSRALQFSLKAHPLSASDNKHKNAGGSGGDSGLKRRYVTSGGCIVVACSHKGDEKSAFRREVIAEHGDSSCIHT